MSCGHTSIELTAHGNIQCLSCDKWFWKKSIEGRRLKKTIKNHFSHLSRLDPSQLATFRALQDSYKEVARLAGTTDPDGIQAYLERRHNG